MGSRGWAWEYRRVGLGWGENVGRERGGGVEMGMPVEDLLPLEPAVGHC